MLLIADPRGTHYGERGELLNSNRTEHLGLEILSLDVREAREGYKGEVLTYRNLLDLSLDCGWLDDIPKAGTILVEDSDDDVDWRKVLVRPVYYVSADDGPWERWNLGVYYVASAPGVREVGGRRRRELQVYDTSKPLHDDALTETLVLTAGTNVVDAVEEILESAHVYRHAIMPSDKTLRVTTSWPATTTKAQVVRDLLNSINYTSLLMDWEGVLRSLPTRMSESDQAVLELSDVRVSPTTGGYKEYSAIEDSFDTPNRWIGRSRAEGDVEPLIAVAENKDPESPTSYYAYGDDTVEGRWITRVTQDIEATDQDSLQAIVDGLLTRATQRGQEYDIQHALYWIDLRETVDFHNSEHGDHLRGLLTHLQIHASLPRVLCNSRIRERARL